MAKTKDGHCYKVETPVTKFAAFVGGEYMETTATSRGQANRALKTRYNEQYKHKRDKNAYVKIEPTAVRSQTQTNPNAASAISRNDPRILPPTEGLALLDQLLNRT